MSWLIHIWLLVGGIAVLLLEDCQSLFLRHDNSGKCISAGNSVYDNSYANPRWARMIDNCLQHNAQFRYLDTEHLQNINTTGTFASSAHQNYRLGSRYGVYVYKGKASGAIKFQNNAIHYLKQTAAGSLSFYLVTACAEPFESGTYESYVERKTDCDSQEQKFTLGSVTPYGATMKDVQCSPKQRMVIKNAYYGDFDQTGVFNDDKSFYATCSALATCRMKPFCNGNISCELTINNTLLPSQHCPDVSKELYTKYNCVDDYSSTPITTAKRVRLTGAYKGYIEIFDGSTWRKVNEENWDLNRQKFLCQHLGFGEIEMTSTGRTRDIDDIATGDLVCYNKQPSGTSCCAYLQPSKISSSITVPFANCQICDKPLLQERTIFPNFVFSGSGGNLKALARISSSGWCASGSGAYLSLDLQKEYHITQVVVMADKEQTKWSSSYLMKYSRDASYENSEQINGNHNGYQASMTRIDIYNVRHVKISTNKDDFCLRVELCGEVQTPAPVYNIKVEPSKTWAIVTWDIITAPERSSYITHYEIYTNQTFREIIYREEQKIQYNMTGLTPYNYYSVGITAVDGSSQTSQRKYRAFRTNEAAPSQPPLDVAFGSRTKNSLSVSWRAPDERSRNGKLKGYRICYSDQEKSNNPTCTERITALTYTINNLQSATKYFVTVSAGTSVGLGPNSAEISRITNGEPVKPVAISNTSLSVEIKKEAAANVMVIVQVGTGRQQPVEDIRTSDLMPYEVNTQNPYVTAYLKADDIPKTFVIGDGNEYNSEKVNYFNQPLKENTSYSVFLRYFESKESYYSTEWSIKTVVKPPAPNVSNIISIGPKKYTISWSLPKQLYMVLKYYATYGPSDGSKVPLDISKEMTSITVDVDYDKTYTFEIQADTKFGRSGIGKKSWQSHSAPLNTPKITEEGYTVTLRKPGEDKKIKTVALVLLKSKSNNPPAPENVKLTESVPSPAEENVAFIVAQFDVSKFEGNSIEIALQEYKGNRRRKREAIEVAALTPKATYRSTQMNTDESGKRIWSYWTEPLTFKGDAIGPNKRDDDDSSSVGVAVGVSVAIVIIVVALVLAVLFFRRRAQKQHNDVAVKSIANEDCDEMKGINNDFIAEPTPQTNVYEDELVVQEKDENIYSNKMEDVDEKQHRPVPIAEFAHYVNEMKANDYHEFNKQYNDLPKSVNTCWEVSKKPFNKLKNRYGNIVTYDYCRVVLSGGEKEDYINASFIDGIKENSYIASQGPKPVTVDDMWRMIWEQRCYSIVMVTSLVELSKTKCEKYWPDKGTKQYGAIEVTLMKTEEFACHSTHTLQIKKDGEEREVRHYYFQSWPDHGVPKYPTQLLAFRRHFRSHHLDSSGPIVVHCSAGVGRTGVFLAIDTILQKFEKGVISSIDVFGEVSAMRERRMNMVQTVEQYAFVHEAILETILCGMNEVDSNKIQKEIEKLGEVKASGMTGFEEKFKRLGEITPNFFDNEGVAGLLEENASKNRNKNIYPAESNRVPLQYMAGVENSDYINAVFVHGYLGRNYFIATQSPLPNTINDFWRLVQSQKLSTIVLLNNVKEGTSFPRFWPTERGRPKQYGELTVQLDSETESDGIWTRRFMLSSSPDLSDGRVVNIFHYTKWPDHRVPPNADGVISLMLSVENSRKSRGQGAIIVACSDGAGRTGTYIAISNLLERMKIEQAVDVFQAIKIIRGTRPQFVENSEQYQFCYTTLLAYLDAFSEYANFE